MLVTKETELSCQLFDTFRIMIGSTSFCRRNELLTLIYLVVIIIKLRAVAEIKRSFLRINCPRDKGLISCGSLTIGVFFLKGRFHRRKPRLSHKHSCMYQPCSWHICKLRFFFYMMWPSCNLNFKFALGLYASWKM